MSNVGHIVAPKLQHRQRTVIPLRQLAVSLSGSETYAARLLIGVTLAPAQASE